CPFLAATAIKGLMPPNAARLPALRRAMPIRRCAGGCTRDSPMRKWTKTAGLLFLAVSSVYTDRVVRAEIGLSAASAAAPEVKPLDGDPTAAPATQPAKPADAVASDLTTDKPSDKSSSTDKSSTDATASADKSGASDASAGADKTAPADAIAVDKPDKVAAPKMTLNDSGTFSIQINNDISLVEVLRMIGNQAQVSVVPSKEVRGTVPA